LVEQAKTEISEDSIRKRLSEVLSISSVTEQERELGNYLKNYMKEIGLYVETEEVASGRFNVYGRTRDSNEKPKVMLNGHYDVVPEGNGWTRAAFGGQIENDSIYGRGASDMKGGLVAMIEATAAIQRNSKDDMIVAAVVDEEVTQSGTKKIVESGLIPQYAIVGEPTRLGVVIAHKGEVVFEIQVLGKSAHSSVPDEGVNSIYHAARIVRQLELDSIRLGKSKKKHPLLGHGTISVDMINGGNGPAIVPAETKIIVDRRMIPGETPEEVQKGFEDTIKHLRKASGLRDLRAFVKPLIAAYPLEIAKDNPLVKAALKSCSKMSGRPSRATGAPYATDGWILANAGVPTIILGPGDIERAHKPDEWISLSEVCNAGRIYSDIVTSLPAFKAE